MGRRRLGPLDLDKALCADRLVAAARGVDVGRVVLRGAVVGQEAVSAMVLTVLEFNRQSG